MVEKECKYKEIINLLEKRIDTMSVYFIIFSASSIIMNIVLFLLFIASL